MTWQEDVSITGWKDNSRATVFPYTVPGRPPTSPMPGHDPVPENRGRCFFMAVDPNTTSQTIDVSALAKEIDAQKIRLKLSGWIGGFVNQDETLTVKAVALNEQGDELDAWQIGPLTPEDRNNKTGFWLLTNDGKAELTKNTRYVRIELIGVGRSLGSVDGWADNLSLILSVGRRETTK